MKVNIGRIDPFSSIEYPGKSAAVIYLSGCNFNCPWCWSHEILNRYAGREREVSSVIQEIEEEPGEIEAVVIDGGEPTQQPEALAEICKTLESKGYEVQVNTNGSNPEVIDEIGIRKNIDRLGLDVKAPLEFPRRYSKVIGRKMKKEWKAGIKEILRGSSLCEYEIEPRTTIVPGLMDSDHWVKEIAKEISIYVDTYVLQGFTPEKGTVEPEYEDKEQVSRERLIELGKEAQRYVKNVKIKTLEIGEEELPR